MLQERLEILVEDLGIPHQLSLGLNLMLLEFEQQLGDVLRLANKNTSNGA